MKIFKNETFDEERALYGSEDTEVISCRFDGPADGESALKESRKITVRDSFFNLRYPFWHDKDLSISGCEMTDKCRAALWYSSGIKISDSRLHGIKALRECSDVVLINCDVISPEFGWSVHGIVMKDSSAEGEYFMMRSDKLDFEGVKLKGKYSFQYIEDSVFKNCDFDTKDAFWHAKNVLVKDSVVKGEYLAWYCENVTFENCTIIGTQPLCYCKGLKLVNCSMIDCDLSFERSDVEASVITKVDSIKNPLAGNIHTAGVGELIIDSDEFKGRVFTDLLCYNKKDVTEMPE